MHTDSRVIITAPEIRDRILMVTVQAVLQAALIVMARDRKKTGRDQQEHTVIRYRCHSGIDSCSTGHRSSCRGDHTFDRSGRRRIFIWKFYLL